VTLATPAGRRPASILFTHERRTLMNKIDRIRDQLPDYAKDLSLNLSTVLTPQGAPGLSQSQILGTALASALASRNPEFAARLEDALRDEMDPQLIKGARAAAAVMAMNNIYYRFVHLAEDGDYARMPARLRMNVMRDPGVEKTDFELFSLAVSAINGCGLCISSHAKTLRAEGVTAEGIQSAVRIAAVIHGVASVLGQIPVTADISQAA